MNPLHVHLALEPRRSGLLFAAGWRVHAEDVLGWFVRPGVGGGALTGYFMLPRRDAARDGAVLRSLGTDVNGQWVETRRDRERPLVHVPVPPSLRRSLARLHDVFVRHWLFFERDPDAFLEGPALRALGIPLRNANVRAARLEQFERMPFVWRYETPGADSFVPVYLTDRLPPGTEPGVDCGSRGVAPGGSAARATQMLEPIGG
jgi:hypothetical protein